MPGHEPISGENSEEIALQGANLVASSGSATFAYPLSLCHHARAFRVSIRGHICTHICIIWLGNQFSVKEARSGPKPEPHALEEQRHSVLQGEPSAGTQAGDNGLER